MTLCFGMHRNILKVPKKILVTGINGFICSHLAPGLLEKGYRVIGVDVSYPKNISKEIKFFRLDLSEDKSYQFLPRDIDIIIHLAALMDLAPAGDRLFEVFKINCLSTLKLLEYARKIKIKKFIFSSTANAIGFRAAAIKEGSRALPEDFYGLTKYLGETLVNHYRNYFKITIMRVFFPYGQNQTDSALIPRLLGNFKKNKEIIIYNQGRNPVLSVIYIEDLVSVILKLINVDLRVINVTSEEKYSILEICGLINEKLGIKPRYKFIEDRKKKNMYADLTELKRFSGYKCKTSLNQGLNIILGKLNE